jgi:hypothetical protein
MPFARLFILALLCIASARADNTTWGTVPKTKGEYITIEEPHPHPTVTAAPAPAVVQPEGSYGDADIDELVRRNDEVQAKLTTLSQTNPASDQFDTEALKERLASSLGVSRSSLERLTGSRKLSLLASYTSGPDVESEFLRIARSPARSFWLWIQIAWVAFFFILREWRIASAKTFRRRLLERAWLYTAFFGGSLFVIPWLMFGSPFFRIVRGGIQILFS